MDRAPLPRLLDLLKELEEDFDLPDESPFEVNKLTTVAYWMPIADYEIRYELDKDIKYFTTSEPGKRMTSFAKEPKFLKHPKEYILDKFSESYVEGFFSSEWNEEWDDSEDKEAIESAMTDAAEAVIDTIKAEEGSNLQEDFDLPDESPFELPTLDVKFTNVFNLNTNTRKVLEFVDQDTQEAYLLKIDANSVLDHQINYPGEDRTEKEVFQSLMRNPTVLDAIQRVQDDLKAEELDEDFELPDESPFTDVSFRTSDMSLDIVDSLGNNKWFITMYHRDSETFIQAVYNKASEEFLEGTYVPEGLQSDGSQKVLKLTPLDLKNLSRNETLKRYIKGRTERLREDFDLPDESPFEHTDIDFSDMNIEIIDMQYPNKHTAIASAVEYDNENSPELTLKCGFDHMSRSYMIKAWVVEGTYNDRSLTKEEIDSLENNREFIGYLEDMIYNDIESGDFEALHEDFELPDESPFEFNRQAAKEEVLQIVKDAALSFFCEFVEEAIVDSDEEDTLEDLLDRASLEFYSNFEIADDYNIPQEIVDGFSEEELESIISDAESVAVSYAEKEITENPTEYISNFDYLGSYNAEDDDFNPNSAGLSRESFELPDESPFQIDSEKLKDELIDYTMQEIGYAFERMTDECTSFPEEHGISHSGREIVRERCQSVVAKELKYYIEDEDTIENVYQAMLEDIDGSEIARLSDIEAKRRIEVMLRDQYKAFLQSL